MKKNNIVSGLFLLGIIGGLVYARPTIIKIGLGVLGGVGIVTSVKFQNKALEEIKADYKSQIKSLNAQLGMKDIEISQIQSQTENIRDEHESKLTYLEQSHRQEIAQLASENHSAFEQKISLINRKHALEIERMKAENEGELQASDEIIDKLRSEKKQLQGTIQTLQKEFESIRDDYAQRVNSLEQERAHFNASQQQFELEQKEFQIRQREIQNAANQNIFLSSKKESEAISQEWQKLNNAKLQFNKTINETRNSFNAIKQENEILRQKLGLSQKVIATNNGRYNTASIEGFLADRIENFFRRSELPISYVQSVATTPDRLKLQFSSKEENKDKIIKLKEALSCDIFGGKDISINRKDGYILIDIPKISSSVEIDKVVSPDTPNTEYFKEFILNSNHFLISGATGDGKTTLISNILDLASKILPGAELIFLNPKPDPDTHFYFKGKRIKANYLNLATPESCKTPNCIEGLLRLKSILMDRMRLAQLAEENNQPMPKFNPMIFFCDEIPSLKDADPALFKAVMLDLSRMARVYKLIFIGSGQGTTVRQWALDNRDQMMNFSRVYLKSVLNVNAVWDNEIKYLPNRDNITKQIDEFKSRTGGKKSASSYYGLFIPQGNSEGEMCYLPAPNYFSGGDNSNSLNCPNCGSVDTIKNGFKHDKQNYQCKSCESQFISDLAVTHSKSGLAVG